MSVKVIRGTVGDVTSDPTNRTQSTNQNSSVAAVQAGAVAAQTSSLVSSEAVSVSVRTVRSVGSSERIKDSREAKDVAEKVADNIRDNETSLEVHDGLNSTNGRAHLA